MCPADPRGSVAEMGRNSDVPSAGARTGVDVGWARWRDFERGWREEVLAQEFERDERLEERLSDHCSWYGGTIT